VHAAIIDDHDFAGFDIADEFGADDFECAAFADKHPGGLGAGQIDAAEDQRADAKGIAHADEGFIGEGDQGVGADHLFQRVDQAVHDGGIQADGDQVDEHLAVHRRLEQAAAADQGAAEGGGVGEVTVMGDGEPAEFEIGEQRLDVAKDGFAGGGVAVMADGAAAGQGGDDAGVGEIIADQAEALVVVEAVAVEGGDAGGFLAAMLERVQAEGGDGGGVRHVPDAEDTAFLMLLVVLPALEFA
jgi:hypothetical protein